MRMPREASSLRLEGLGADGMTRFVRMRHGQPRRPITYLGAGAWMSAPAARPEHSSY